MFYFDTYKNADRLNRLLLDVILTEEMFYILPESPLHSSLYMLSV